MGIAEEFLIEVFHFRLEANLSSGSSFYAMSQQDAHAIENGSK
jgi:hypothetical protein